MTFFNSYDTTSFVLEVPTQPMASCVHRDSFSDSDPSPSSLKDPCGYTRPTRYSSTISPSRDPYSRLQSPCRVSQHAHTFWGSGCRHLCGAVLLSTVPPWHSGSSHTHPPHWLLFLSHKPPLRLGMWNNHFIIPTDLWLRNSDRTQWECLVSAHDVWGISW